eukprot:5209616-Prymnesium_polylepis.1
MHHRRRRVRRDHRARRGLVRLHVGPRRDAPRRRRRVGAHQLSGAAAARLLVGVPLPLSRAAVA